MLAATFVYALKSALVLTLLYLVYRVSFHKVTRYQLKRFALLAILATSMALPALEMRTAMKVAPIEPIANQIDTVIEVGASVTPTSEVANTVASGSFINSPGMAWSEVILYVYLAGILISFLIFLYQLISVLYVMITGNTRHDLGRKMVAHKRIRSPFSFWNLTFLPIDFNMSNEGWTIVHEHELAHQRQAHSIDLLCTALVKCFLWFTPAVYYLLNSMRENHEFLADEHVLKTHSIDHYSAVLLSVSMQADSIQLTHSFALKSNLSQRISQMNTAKTSYLKSGMAVCILLCFTLLTASQVSLYGQDNRELEAKDKLLQRAMRGPSSPGFSPLTIYEKTGQFPDAWASFRTKGVSPVMLLEKHKAILEAFKKSSETSIEGQSDRLYHITLRKDKDPEFGDLGAHELKKNKFRTELIQELSAKEKIEMYALAKAWSDKYIAQVYPDYQMISELDFMEKSYLVFQSQPNPTDPRKYSVKTVFKSNQVDLLPEPIGGLDRYLENVTKYCEKDPELDLNTLPKKIEFEFTIDPGGNMVMVSLKSKVRGPEATQDKIWDLLKQVNDNLIKVSDVYGWKPGEKDGTTVATLMRLTIPKELF